MPSFASSVCGGRAECDVCRASRSAAGGAQGTAKVAECEQRCQVKADSGLSGQLSGLRRCRRTGQSGPSWPLPLGRLAETVPLHRATWPGEALHSAQRRVMSWQGRDGGGQRMRRTTPVVLCATIR